MIALSLVVLTMSSVACVPQAAQSQHQDLGLGLHFEENLGQTAEEVRFLARQGRMTAFLVADGIHLSLIPAGQGEKESGTAASVKLEFEGAAAAAELDGLDPLTGRANYFRGSDPERWVTGVPLFRRVRYADLMPGVDLELHGSNGVLEYDVILEPSKSLSQLIVRCHGADSLRVTDEGRLEMRTAAGLLHQDAPVAWVTTEAGERVPVECGFRVLAADRFGFEIIGKRPPGELTVDPGLRYATFVGGSSLDFVGPVEVGPSGDIHAALLTTSPDLPTTFGAYDTGMSGSSDVGLVKVSPQGGGASDLVYATFLGGSGDDEPGNLYVDAAGNAYVVGMTNSADFPVTAQAVAPSYLGGSSDGFCAKISPGGNGSADLLYASYVGSDAGGFASIVTADAGGMIYVGGEIGPGNMMTTAGALATSYNGGSLDGYLWKIDPATAGAAGLLYATYLGGSGKDTLAQAMEVGGRILVVGETRSPDFPTSTGAFQTTYGGVQDGYYIALDPLGGGAADLAYGTFVGGSGLDECNDLDLSSGGEVQIVGSAESGDLPVTSGALQTTLAGMDDVMILTLDPAGAGSADLLYMSYVGTPLSEDGKGIGVLPDGRLALLATTDSPDFPTTLAGFDNVHNGGTDAVLMVLDTSLAGTASLAYSSYFGGSGEDSFDFGNEFSLDANGRAYFGGFTTSADLPTTVGAMDDALSGPVDGFLVSFDLVDGPVLSHGPLQRGQSTVLQVDQAGAGQLIYFGLSVTGLGSGPCLGSVGGACLDLLPPLHFLGSATANGLGVATLTITVPSNAPLIQVHTQAVAVGSGAGGAGSLPTNPVTTTVLP